MALLRNSTLILVLLPQTFNRIKDAIDMVNLTHQTTEETFQQIHAAVAFTYATFAEVDSAIENTDRTFGARSLYTPSLLPSGATIRDSMLPVFFVTLQTILKSR